MFAAMKQKKKTRSMKEKQELRNDLINRVVKAKDKLPASGVTSLFIHKHPEYDTIKKRSRLNNVLQFRVTDEKITGLLEELAKAV